MRLLAIFLLMSLSLPPVAFAESLFDDDDDYGYGSPLFGGPRRRCDDAGDNFIEEQRRSIERRQQERHIEELEARIEELEHKERNLENARIECDRKLSDLEDCDRKLSDLEDEIEECNGEGSSLSDLIAAARHQKKETPEEQSKDWMQSVLTSDCQNPNVAYSQAQRLIQKKFNASEIFPAEPASTQNLGEGRYQFQFSTEAGSYAKVQDGDRVLSQSDNPAHSYTIAVRCLSNSRWVAEEIKQE